jgi:hypothetical protein
MVPIHDTDVAEERWTQAEWEHYELWEKVEQRLRRRRRIWVIATAAAYLAISAVPIIKEQWPKWVTLEGTRQLAQQINRIKRDANIDHAAYRLTFPDEAAPNYEVEKLKSCDDSKGTIVRTGTLGRAPAQASFVLLRSVKAAEMGIAGLTDAFCYDHLKGSQSAAAGVAEVGFGLIPAKDLTEGRPDRLSVLLLSGAVAEVSFE